MANVVEIIVKARDETKAAMDGANKRVDKLNDTLKKHRFALLAAGTALVAFGAVTVKAASDLTEATNKSAVVFGKHQQQVEDFARTSARTYGISKRAAFEYSGTLGTILTASGLAEEATAGMSVELVQLAADLASFNNIPIEVALNKLRSGLVGEVEPLRTVGILLSQVAVNAKAAELGLLDANGTLSEAAKVQARYALILESTTKEQGDAIRTAGDLAGQLKRVEATTEDARAALGEALIPIVTVAAGKLAEMALKVSELDQSQIGLVVNVGLGAAALVGLGLVIPPITAVVGTLASGVIALGVTALAPLVAVLLSAAGAFKVWRDNVEGAARAVEIIDPALALLDDKSVVLTRDINALGQTVIDLSDGLVPASVKAALVAEELAAIGDAARDAIPFVGTLREKLELLQGRRDGAPGTVPFVSNALNQVWLALGQAVLPVIGSQISGAVQGLVAANPPTRGFADYSGLPGGHFLSRGVPAFEQGAGLPPGISINVQIDGQDVAAVVDGTIGTGAGIDEQVKSE